MATSLALGERRTIVPNVLVLTYLQNGRGAMGLLGGDALALTLFAAGALAVLWFVLRAPLAESSLAQVGFGLIAGGAVGNVVDRLVHGYVIDFVALPHFYVFNLADAAIAGGLALVALPSIRASDRSAAAR